MRKLSLYIVYIVVLVLVLGVWGCKQKRDAAEGGAAEQAREGAKAGAIKGDLVISGGETRVMLRDYEACVLVYALHGRAASERAVANPRFQRDEALRCYQRKFALQYLEREGRALEAAALEHSLQRALAANAVGSKDELLAKLGVDAELLEAALKLDAVFEALQSYLIATMQPGEKDKELAKAHRRFDVEFACFENEANHDEIMHFQQEHRSEVLAHFGKFAAQYNSPALVKLERYAFNFEIAGGEDAARATAENFIRELPDNKSAKALCDAVVACRCEGCDSPLIEQQSESNLWAFRTAQGAFSELVKADADFLLYRSVGFVAPQPRSLDLELELEIARELLRAKPLDSLLAKLKEALEVEGEVDLSVKTLELGGEYQHPEKDYYYRLKSAGLPPMLWRVLGETQRVETMLFSNPIVEDGKLCIFRVLSLQDSSIAEQRRLAASYFEQRAREMDLVEEFLQNNMPRTSQLNVLPLQRHYGQLQEDGSILK
ncbi:MAG: hypothetical protein WC966_04110 [Bradymonadales bacterium]|jgi:hypothetical protein